MPNLFSPVKLGSLSVPNRIVMAPMTRSRALAAGVPNPLAAIYYTQRASAGLLISEATQVSPRGQGYIDTPGIHTDAQVAGWRAITDAVHAASGRIFLQLWHVGRISHTSFQPNGEAPVAPSAITAPGVTHTATGPQPFSTPRALETSEIADVVTEFALGAKRALDAGFDGVEIHGANGYLPDQFLRDGTNHRTDRYGGSIANRARFLLEVTDAVSGVVGKERVGVRLSPNAPYNGMSDSNPAATFGYAAKELGSRGIAYLHVVEGTHGGAHALAPALRAAFGGTFIANGGYLRDSANAAIANQEADLIAFGTTFLANPDLVARLAANAPLNAPRPELFYGGGSAGYTDYPTLSELALNQPVAADLGAQFIR